jgi:hypothetical protein
MPTTAIKHLKPHPAQMRTTYDLEALATLTLQIYERGLDNWQPVVASPNGETYPHHQRPSPPHGPTAGLCLAGLGQDRSGQSDTGDYHRGRADHDQHPGGIAGDAGKALIASLLAKYGERRGRLCPFEGSQKAQILALQAPTTGARRQTRWASPTAFARPWKPGDAEEEIARNAGQHVNYVRNHLALTRSRRSWRGASLPASCP